MGWHEILEGKKRHPNRTPEQLDLSFKTGWNDIALIERIESGWTPRHAEAFIQAAEASQANPPEAPADKTQTVK